MPPTAVNVRKSLAVTAMALSLAVPAFSAVHTQAQAASPTNQASALLKRGYGQICLGLYGAAIKTLNNALSASPDNIAARRYLCYALLQNDQISEALEKLKPLTTKPRVAPIDLYLLGEIHLRLGWIDAAEVDFANALKAQPDLAAATIGAIKVQVCNSDFDGALRACSDWLRQKRPATPANAKLVNYFQQLMASIREAQASAGSNNGIPPQIDNNETPPPPEFNVGA